MFGTSSPSWPRLGCTSSSRPATSSARRFGCSRSPRSTACNANDRLATFHPLLLSLHGVLQLSQSQRRCAASVAFRWPGLERATTGRRRAEKVACSWRTLRCAPPRPSAPSDKRPCQRDSASSLQPAPPAHLSVISLAWSPNPSRPPSLSDRRGSVRPSDRARALSPRAAFPQRRPLGSALLTQLIIYL